MIPLNDVRIRNVVMQELLASFSHDPDTLVLEELGLRHGLARIDIAIVNNSMQGFEIKSDRDTLDRLPNQMQVYNSIFDQVTIVVGSRLSGRIIAGVPDWWGIRVAHLEPSNQVTIDTIRKPRQNPGQDIVAITKLLWRGEALALLQELNNADGVRSKPRSVVYSRLAESADPGWLCARVREQLRQRKGWRSASPRMSCDD